MLIKILNQFSYQSFPIVDGMIEVSDEELKEIGKTKCFDVKAQTVIDYVKPEPTLEQKLAKYPILVEEYIREKYSISAELAILRQKDDKPGEFEEYNTYAEACKLRAKKNLGIEEDSTNEDI